MNQTSSVMLSLSKKHLITKAGKLQKSVLWLPLVEFRIVSLGKISTNNDLVVNDEPIKGRKINPRIEVCKLSNVLNSWFGSCEIVESELIYYPVYDVRLASKHHKRHLKISGVSGRVL